MATIRDVAKTAGVAASTVSHVFNGTAPISEETTHRVLEAATRLGYVPRHQRRDDKRRKQIVIFRSVVPDQPGETEPLPRGDLSEPIVLAAYRVLKAQGCDVWVVPYEEDHVAGGVDPVYLYGFSGVLVANGFVQTFSSFPEIPLPTVLANCTAESKPYLSVVPDDFRGSYEATRHLIRLGHRRIAFINGPEDWLAGRDRLQGYQAALQEFAIAQDDAIVTSGDWTIPSGREAMEEILLRTSFTALFAANDLMAFGAMQVLQQNGVRIPDDVAVVGYDNRSISTIATPSLTTVQLPLDNVGKRAALELLQLINDTSPRDDTSASRIQIHCPILIRESCGSTAKATVDAELVTG